MRRLKKNIATAMITAMSLSMLPAQMWGTTASAATTKKIVAKKIEMTVSTNKGLKSALKKGNINKIVLNAASTKNFRVPKGNYKDKILVINSSDKSKVYIPKGTKFKKIIYLGTVKNANLVVDETGNKIEIASKITLNISGKAAYAELTYKTGAESAKVTSKIELIASNKTKKSIKATIAGKKVIIKAGDTYASSDLDIDSDDTPQGTANIDVNDDSTPQGSAATTDTGNTAGNTTNTGSTGGGYIGGGSTGGGSNTNSGNNTPQTPAKEANKIVNTEKTKVIDATSFLRYVVVSFVNGYTKDNTTVYVDGTDVTSELTKVDTEGTLYKWEVYGKYPSEVKVVSNKDKNISQTVKLDRPTGAKLVKPIVTNKRRTPEFVIGSSRISRFDYYLDNFDNEGNRRMKPGITTFNSDFKASQKISERPYYAPDVEVGKDLTVMFNYTSDDDKKWFDNIPKTGALQLVEDSDNQYTIKKDVQYEKKFVEHGGQKAALVIKTGGTNFRSAGYFRLRVMSEGSKSYMLRVRLEYPGQPRLFLREPVLKSGKNLHFDVEGVTLGVKNAVEKVELTLPNKEVRTLRHNIDYFFFGNLFVLYNDVTKGKEEDGTKGINNTLYKGEYSLKIYFNEYKPATVGFDIPDGQEAGKKNETTADKVTTMGSKSSLLSMDGMKFDAVAGATRKATPGGNRGDYTGSLTIVRDLIFDVDLLANAEIFDELGIKNDYAKAIVDRFEKEVTVKAVYNHNSDFYDFGYYNTAMIAKRDDGMYLSFSDYMKQDGVKTINKIKKANAVLEDNLIGGVLDGNQLGEEAPKFTIPNEGKVSTDGKITLQADAAYLAKVKALHPEREKGQKYMFTMSSDDYKVDGDKLTIRGIGLINRYFPNLNTLPRKVKVIVVADGYQAQTIELTVVKPDENALKTLEMPDKFTTFHIGNTLSFGTTSGIRNVNDWMKNIVSITVGGVKYNRVPNGRYSVKDENEFYVGSSVEITLPKSKSNNIPMVIEATGYKTYTFTIDNSGEKAQIVKGEETDGTGIIPKQPEQKNPETGKETETPKLNLDEIVRTETANDAPDAKSLTIPEDKKLYVQAGYKKLSIGAAFTGNGAEVIAWLEKVNSVKVDGVNYTKGSGFGLKDKQFKFSFGSMEINRPEKKAVIPMVIKAEGYKTYVFTFNNSSEDSVQDTFKLINGNKTEQPKPDDKKDNQTPAPGQDDKQTPGDKEKPKDKKEDNQGGTLLELPLPQTFKVGISYADRFTIKKYFLGEANKEATQKWIDMVTEVTVNGRICTYGNDDERKSLNEYEFRKVRGNFGDLELQIARPYDIKGDANKAVSLEIEAKGYKTYIFTFDNSSSKVEVIKGEEKKTVAPAESDKAREEEKKAKEEQEKKEQEEKKKQEAEAAKKAEEAKKQAAVTRASEAAGRANTEAERADDEAKKAEEVASKSESAKDIAVKARTAANLAKEAAERAKAALAEAEKANNSVDAEAAATKAETEAETAKSKAIEAETARQEAETKKAEEDAKKNSLKSLNLSADQPLKLDNFTEYTFFIKSENFIKNGTNVLEWIKNIESITFDGEMYTETKKSSVNKKEYKIDAERGEVKIRRPQKKTSGLALIIKSKGFKTYEFTFDNSSKSNRRIAFVREIEG